MYLPVPFKGQTSLILTTSSWPACLAQAVSEDPLPNPGLLRCSRVFSIFKSSRRGVQRHDPSVLNWWVIRDRVLQSDLTKSLHFWILSSVPFVLMRHHIALACAAPNQSWKPDTGNQAGAPPFRSWVDRSPSSGFHMDLSWLVNFHPKTLLRLGECVECVDQFD